MNVLKTYYDLKNQVEFLSADEERNWNSYQNFVKEQIINKNKIKIKTLDYINQLGYLKREIEKKILEEYKKIENLDKPIGIF